MRQAEETLSSWDELLYIDLIYNRESKETDAIETGAAYGQSIRFILAVFRYPVSPKTY